MLECKSIKSKYNFIELFILYILSFLPLQGVMLVIFVFPGCYPGLCDRRLSALGYSITNILYSLSFMFLSLIFYLSLFLAIT